MLPCLNDKDITRIDLFTDGDPRWYRLPNHMHDFTTAFGPTEQRLGSNIEGPVEESFYIEDGEPLDGCIKLTASFMTMYSNVSYVRVLLNGFDIWSGNLHLPRVCAGWPSIYLVIPSGFLRAGRNELELDAGGVALNINQCSVFVRSKTTDAAKILFTPRVLTVGQRFCVTLLCQRPVLDIGIEHSESLELVSSPQEMTVGEQDIFFVAHNQDENPHLTFSLDGEKLSVLLPPVLDVPAGLPCHVGMDSDDHPHDDTGMMDQIISYFYRSGIGDLVMFRPKQGRNCIVSPTADLSRRWIELCKNFGGKYQICEWHVEGEFPSEIHEEMAVDPDFVGYHFHEPYFMMVEPYSDERLRRASDFQERRDAYVASLKRYADRGRALGGRPACGEASWLAAYDAEAGFDIINIEVVTAFSPQAGAALGALRGRPNTSLGHHIAIEWYLGFPYDDLKSHRFWLMMLLTYSHGGEYIYAENSLFFTNSNERHDPEDTFTSRNRELMRRFFDMTKLQPRIGEMIPELAVIYGNLESALCYHDDVLPEMDDASEWGTLIWNKWRGAMHKPCMRALDGWLPPVEIEKYHANRSTMKWFAGNPYGNVEMISAERPIEVLSQFKVLALLGWNTMTLELIEKLKDYVRGGGTLFISACHFDRRTLPGGEYEIDTSGAEDLLGLSVSGPGQAVRTVRWSGQEFPIKDDLRLCELELNGAQILAKDDSGVPVLLHHTFGDGEVYFYNFWDHPATPDALVLSKQIMAHLGEKSKDEFGIDDSYGINCSHWHDSDKDIHRLYLINVNWMKPQTSRTCRLRLWGKPYFARVDGCDPLIVTVKGSVAVIPDSPHVFVEDVIMQESSCCVRLIGTGKHCIRVILSDSNSRLLPQGCEAMPENGSQCTITVNLKGKTDLRFALAQVS